MILDRDTSTPTGWVPILNRPRLDRDGAEPAINAAHRYSRYTTIASKATEGASPNSRSLASRRLYSTEFSLAFVATVDIGRIPHVLANAVLF